MPTYQAQATATASVNAKFFFREEQIVTGSGSATAESNVSEEHAYNIALNLAQEAAQNAAQNAANVIIQSVNISIPDNNNNNFFLSSSLLNGYITQVSSNEYDLVKNFFLTKYILNIEAGQILNINEGVTLSCAFINKGIINNYGNYNTPDFTQILQKNNTKTNKSTPTYQIYDVLNQSTINNYNTIYISDFQTYTNTGTTINYGSVLNAGSIYNYGEFIQDISGNTEIINYNIIDNYYNTELSPDSIWASYLTPGTIYYGTITINGGSFYNSTNIPSDPSGTSGIINLNYSTQGSEIPPETYFLTINNGNMYCQDPSNVTPPIGYYNVYWNTATTPTIDNENVYYPIYSNSYTSGTSDPSGNPYALAAQQINPGIVTFYSS